MEINVHIHHHSDPNVKDVIMAVSAAIQALLDQVKASTTIEASADLAMKALSQQIMDLGTQIAALQLQLANGGTLHPDDLAALSSAQADLAQSAAKLQTDIPANTTTTPPVAVLGATATSVTSASNPAEVGSTVVLTAAVTQPGSDPHVTTPTGTVTFMDAGVSIGTGTIGFAGSASFSTSDLKVGDHPITASYGGDSANAASTSSALVQTITAAKPTA